MDLSLEAGGLFLTLAVHLGMLSGTALLRFGLVIVPGVAYMAYRLFGKPGAS